MDIYDGLGKLCLLSRMLCIKILTLQVFSQLSSVSENEAVPLKIVVLLYHPVVHLGRLLKNNDVVNVSLKFQMLISNVCIIFC